MAETVTELRALAERLADEYPPELDHADLAAYAWWHDTQHRTVLAAADESVDLLREAVGPPRPDGIDALPITRAEQILMGALDLAQRWAIPPEIRGPELASHCVYGIPARPGRGYRHHPELVRVAREALPAEHQRALNDHPTEVVSLADAHAALDVFEREATRLAIRVVQ